MSKPQNNSPEEQKYEERILHLRRVSKKTSGGNYISFSALVAIGDNEGNVGLGIGRGLEVPPAIKKAIAQAKKNGCYCRGNPCGYPNLLGDHKSRPYTNPHIHFSTGNPASFHAFIPPFSTLT